MARARMGISVTCSACGAMITVPDASAGAGGRCMACGAPIQVPKHALAGTRGLATAELTPYRPATIVGPTPVDQGPPAKPHASQPSPPTSDDDQMTLIDEPADYTTLRHVMSKPASPTSAADAAEVEVCAGCDVICIPAELQEVGGKRYCATCYPKALARRPQHLALNTQGVSPESALTATIVEASGSAGGDGAGDLSDACVVCQTIMPLSDLVDVKGKLVCRHCYTRLAAAKRSSASTAGRSTAGGSAAGKTARGSASETKGESGMPAVTPPADTPSLEALGQAANGMDAALAALQAMGGPPGDPSTLTKP